MTAIPVDRYMFTVDEVVAALLPNVGRAREVELRVDADGYVVVDIVAPVDRGSTATPVQHEPTADEIRERRPDTPADLPQSQPGPYEAEARSLCRAPLFKAFLEVKTEEAALKVMAERCHVQRLADLDRTRSSGLNLRYVIEEFEAWKIT